MSRSASSLWQACLQLQPLTKLPLLDEIFLGANKLSDSSVSRPDDLKEQERKEYHEDRFLKSSGKIEIEAAIERYGGNDQKDWPHGKHQTDLQILFKALPTNDHRRSTYSTLSPQSQRGVPQRKSAKEIEDHIAHVANFVVHIALLIEVVAQQQNAHRQNDIGEHTEVNSFGKYAVDIYAISVITEVHGLFAFSIILSSCD